MLVLDLTPVLNARNITKPYSFLVKGGLTHHTATNILNKYSRQLHINNLGLLCKMLCCEPSDLFTWIPDKNDRLQADHPLHNLAHRQNEPPADLSAVPYQKVKELNKKIAEELGRK